jgi:hypothetical protein
MADDDGADIGPILHRRGEGGERGARLVARRIGAFEAKVPCGERRHARLLELVHEAVSADDKRVAHVGPRRGEPACRDEGGGYHLFDADGAEAQPSEALGVLDTRFGCVVRDEDAFLAQPLEQRKGLDRAWKQAVLAAPLYAVAIEEEGIVCLEERARLCGRLDGCKGWPSSRDAFNAGPCRSYDVGPSESRRGA